MQINGDRVEVEDTVFSPKFGVGTVTQVWADGCYVVFQGSPFPVGYEQGGFLNGQRALYWQAPLVIEGHKHTNPNVLAKAGSMAMDILEMAK